MDVRIASEMKTSRGLWTPGDWNAVFFGFRPPNILVNMLVTDGPLWRFRAEGMPDSGSSFGRKSLSGARP